MDGGGILSDGEDLRNKPLPSYTKIVNSLENTSMTCMAQDKEIREVFNRFWVPFVVQQRELQRFFARRILPSKQPVSFSCNLIFSD